MIKEFFRAADELSAEILFPRRCPVCGEIVMPKGELICPDCKDLLSYVEGPFCFKCGKELPPEAEGREYCTDCMRVKKSFDFGAALVNYDAVARRSMAGIKYRGRKEYLDFYAEDMAHRLAERIGLMAPDVLIPVPVHPERKRKRGYNQAEELSLRLGGLIGVPTRSDIIIRKKNTEAQKELGAGERRKNLSEAFGLAKKAEEICRDIDSACIVDDIYTTGATVDACASLLKRAGIGKVSYVSICIGAGRCKG